MTGPQIITHLRTLIIETEDQIADYTAKRIEKEAFKVHLGAVIAHFESQERPYPSPANMSVARLFQRGEAFAHCVRAFQQEGPELTTTQLAAYCLKVKTLDPSEKPLLRAMTQSLIEILKMRQSKGEIVSDRKEGVCRVWRLP